jgi:hypothetical protein
LSTDSGFRPKALELSWIVCCRKFCLYKQDSSLRQEWRRNLRGKLNSPKGTTIKLSFIVLAIHEFFKSFWVFKLFFFFSAQPFSVSHFSSLLNSCSINFKRYYCRVKGKSHRLIMEIYSWRSELLMITTKLLALLSLVELKISTNSFLLVKTLWKERRGFNDYPKDSKKRKKTKASIFISRRTFLYSYSRAIKDEQVFALVHVSLFAQDVGFF